MILIIGFLSLLVSSLAGGDHIKGGFGTPVQQVVQDAVIEDIPKPYAFGFQSGGPYVHTTREEVRDPEGIVKGTYTISNPRGHNRVVEYTADDSGFKATVQTSEPNIKSHEPANVHYRAVSKTGFVHQQVAQHDVDPFGGAAGGLGGSAFGSPAAIQFAIGDQEGFGSFQPISQRHLYRTGQSQVPFGLSGLDYYSYPSYRLGGRRVKTVDPSGRKGIATFASGARSPAFLGSAGGIKGGLGSGVISGGEPTIQFTLGDPQQIVSKTIEPVQYRTGQSLVPFGLSGLDYYSYPTYGYGARRVKTVDPSGRKGIATFSSGARSPAFLGSAGGIKGGLGSGVISGGEPTIQFTLGDPQQIVSKTIEPVQYRTGQSLIPFGMSGFDYYSYPDSIRSRPITYRQLLTKTASYAYNNRGAPAFLGSGFGNGRVQAVPSPLGQQKVFTSGGFGDPSVGRKVSVKTVQTPSYRIGQSRIPFGVSGLDYYSYPSGILSGAYSRKQIRPSGLGGIGGGIRRAPAFRTIQQNIGTGPLGAHYDIPGGVATIGASDDIVQQRITPTSFAKSSDIAAGSILGGPGQIQFTLGDPQGGFASRGVPYRIQQSQVPYGLSGFDYYSYPEQLYRPRQIKTITKTAGPLPGAFAQRRVKTLTKVSDAGLGAAAPGNIHFTLGSPHETAPISPVVAVKQTPVINIGSVSGGIPIRETRPFVQKKIITKTAVAPADGGLRYGQRRAPAFISRSEEGPANIQFTLGDPQLGLRQPAISQSRVSYLDQGPAGGIEVISGGEPALHFDAPRIVSKPAPVRKIVSAPAVVSSRPVAGFHRTSPLKILREQVRGQAVATGPGIQYIQQGSPFLPGPASYVKRPYAGLRRTSPAKVVQEQVRVGADGVGPNIQFTLGDSQIISGSSAFDSRPVEGLRRTAPGRVVQEPVRSHVDFPGPGHIEFSIGDLSAAGRPAVADVTEVVAQRPVQLSSAPAALGGGSNIQFSLGDASFAQRPASYIRQAAPSLRRTAPARVIQTQVRDVAEGAGPNIQFTLGDSQIISGPQSFDSSPIGGLRSVGYSSRPAGTLRRTSPVKVVQEQVVGDAIGPNIQFSLGDTEIIPEPAPFDSQPIGGLRQVSPLQVVRQRPLGLTSAGYQEPVIQQEVTSGLDGTTSILATPYRNLLRPFGGIGPFMAGSPTNYYTPRLRSQGLSGVQQVKIVDDSGIRTISSGPSPVRQEKVEQILL